jgi:SAM-dependent methyltransferase
MASLDQDIARHYGGAGLSDQILAGLVAAGVDKSAVMAEHLKPVDEFHIGGVAATEALLDPLKPGRDTRVLDLGCGIGGTARFIARRYGATVTGIDLTPDFVATAERLTALVGLEATYHIGSVLDLPFEDESFDLVTLIHVGMNIADKPRLFAEASRVLAPGGIFAVYDVMLFGSPPAFPVPWASTPDVSALARPDAYLSAADAQALRLRHRRDRGEIAKAFFAEIQAKMAASGPPPVGLPIIMGENAKEKVANMVAAVNAGDIQPVEMVFEKPA